MSPPTLSILSAFTEQNELRLRYALANPSGSAPIFVLNLYPDDFKQLNPPPRSAWSPELAPTCYLERGGTLLFMAGIVERPLHAGKTYYADRRPLGMIVAVGETLTCTLRAPLPIAEWSPYREPVRAAKQVVAAQVSRLRLCVQYLQEQDVTIQQPHPRQPGAFQISGHDTRLLRVDMPLSSAVSVLKRADEFPRFGQIDGDS